MCRLSGPVGAVVFDMDGLLIDSERVIFDAMKDVAARHQIMFGLAEFSQLVGRTKAASAPALQAILADRMTAAAFEAAAGQIVRQVFADGIPLKAGAPELLAYLAGRKVPMAVATSTGRVSATWKLERSGLLHHLAHVVGGDEVVRSKPAPDIYLEAARRLGVEPDVCVAFEDSENGVRAALAAGMRVVQVPDIIAPNDDVRALGHRVAATLLAGAAEVGLLHHELSGSVGQLDAGSGGKR